ncbi:hypothetical protein A2954_05340 [Candidatus Roizmanbacteria bacterium RIFCSPLOWO2_01_FULL_37_12]|uniref:Uncharacterized protein n=1 Tax=Candidatus Roizmanbacteria bacterium RIFCSPLOWO2_01_FULL_37_12 TaxID=1802056 RepID=A0A1F7IDE3_9BACT|nr:MAG: hypothetical protein A2768_00185 [Candidatus Roizmanbacteria bacterium RIFCSPHIGHO2_01_FULL_37_16]OGK26446.1 MAG: hypothetical protein A3D76_02960 [Candidatus Roizmanbacteria bacterium RIFCSPHIGHO2_02_FULL_37_9b]OGK41382.1 MAG: hypothetical protein A2954_05340 [Candidatus Roizmanbacteria bacterium RIFCSPLOWO2_01_FULL_37_12]
MKHKRLKGFKQTFLTAGRVLFFILIFVYVLTNIFFSQNLSHLYFELVKEDRAAVVSFLNKLKKLPIFPEYLRVNKKIYGDALEKEVFAENVKRKQTIAEAELLLEKNPKSRDILYNLYLLYKEDGDDIKAGEYLRRAKEVDPAIQN